MCGKKNKLVGKWFRFRLVSIFFNDSLCKFTKPSQTTEGSRICVSLSVFLSKFITKTRGKTDIWIELMDLGGMYDKLVVYKIKPT